MHARGAEHGTGRARSGGYAPVANLPRGCVPPLPSPHRALLPTCTSLSCSPLPAAPPSAPCPHSPASCARPLALRSALRITALSSPRPHAALRSPCTRPCPAPRTPALCALSALPRFPRTSPPSSLLFALLPSAPRAWTRGDTGRNFISLGQMDPALFRAAHTGDVEALDNLLKEHPRICNQFTGRNNTALHFAAEHGHSQFVRKLLDVKPGLSGLVNRDGNTALHGASKQGHSEVVSILLHHNKLDAHALNLYGESALFMASEEGHVAVVSQLLQVHSPRIKLDFKRRSDGQTCCHAASQHGHLGVVIELIRRRPDMIVSVDKYGATPLHSAVSAGHTQIVRELVRSVPSLCYKLDRGGRSPLHVAAMKGYVSVVQELLCLRPDCMESLSKDGKTALHVAAENDQIQMVELLLSFPKLKVNAMNEQGHTALDIACKDTDHVASMRGIVEALERKGGMKSSGNGSNKCVKKLKKLGDSPGISTVVAALITTLTFDAVFAVPGWNQNDIYTNWNQNISFPGLTAQSPNPPLSASLNLGSCGKRDCDMDGARAVTGGDSEEINVVQQCYFGRGSHFYVPRLYSSFKRCRNFVVRQLRRGLFACVSLSHRYACFVCPFDRSPA
eukprot:Gb_26253 [translate_table: standard]